MEYLFVRVDCGCVITTDGTGVVGPARPGLLIELADQIRLISALGRHLRMAGLSTWEPQAVHARPLGPSDARIRRSEAPGLPVSHCGCYRDSAPGLARPVGDR